MSKYSKEEFISAVQNSKSLRQVLCRIGLRPAGGNYVTVHKTIELYQLDTSHFTGKAWNKGKTNLPKRPLEDYFNGVLIQSNKLRLRLLQDRYFKHQCSNCRRKTWLGSPIPLELDHINGDRLDNNLSNLRLLCPNCHARTSTYRGRNIPLIKLRSVLPSALPVKDSPNLTPFT